MGYGRECIESVMSDCASDGDRPDLRPRHSQVTARGEELLKPGLRQAGILYPANTIEKD